MEAFVSDLLENADLGVITKKDVRVKYKTFVGRDISSEEKAKINDLVYAFVFYHAAKQKKLEDSKQKTVGPSPVRDKENKLALIKGMKNGKHISSNNSQVLKGRVTDKSNIKNLKRKHSLESESTDREMNSTAPTRRKSYPMRQRKHLPGMRYDDVISAIMESASEESDLSESSESDLEYNEDEKEKINLAVKKLQAEREIKIQLALARKKASLRKIGKECLVLKRINDVKNSAIQNSTPVNDNSDESVILLLSDIESPDSVGDSVCVKSPIKQTPSSEKSGDLTKNKTHTTDSKHKMKNLPSDKWKDSVSGNVNKMKNPIKPMSSSDDSEDLTVIKTDTNYSKHKKNIMSSNGKKDSVSVKVNKMKSPINPMSSSDGSGDLALNKADTNYSKLKKNVMSSNGKKDSVGVKVKKMKSPIKLISSSDDSGDLTVNKTPIIYSKHKKKLTPSHEKKKSVSGKGSEMNRIKQLKTDSDSELDTQPVKKKSKMSLGIKVRKKQAYQVEIMKLVKSKREAGALKKLKKTGKNENCGTGEITVTNKGKLSTDCDIHSMNDCSTNKLETIKDQGKVVSETESSSWPVSSKVSDCDSVSVLSMGEEEGRLNDSLETLSTTTTDSPIKTTPSQLAKKEHNLLLWKSDEESGENISDLKESKAALKNEEQQLVMGEDFQALSVGSKPNKNGVILISEDSSDEDEPLSQIKEKIRMVTEQESPYVLQLRKICKASGIFVRGDRQLKDCSSNDEKTLTLKNLLKDAGMKGQPSMNKAEELLLLKEASELNRKNIITTTKTGRAMRNVKSIYARPNTSPPSTDESTENGIMSPLNGLKGIFESESSE